jgi:hypothetical protein
MTAAPAQPLATVLTGGGAITLHGREQRLDTTAGLLDLVLYWTAGAPVKGNYTVFTQLFDAAGAMIAQQDNVPMGGTAPTDTWQPDAMIRDTYELVLPPDAPPGPYTLHVGMYDAAGRQPVRLADGTEADHVTLPVDEAHE